MAALLTRLLPLALPLVATAALADPVRLDLNALHPRDGACQMVFVAQNPTATDLERLTLEAVLFGTDGTVAALTLLELQDLPAGRMRVRSFEMAGLDCHTLARLLVNGIADCAPAGAPGCAPPQVTSRTGLEVLE